MYRTIGRRLGPPSLLLVFGALSLAIVVGIGLALGAVLQDSIRSRAIADASRTGEVAAIVGVQPFLEVADLEQNFLPLAPERISALDDSLGSSLSPNGIVRLKVWNRQHWLIYSDNAQLRGRWFAGAETLEKAFEGELTSEITDLTAPEEREERDFGELLAVYVPLRLGLDGGFTSGTEGEVIGAFEIYLPFEPIASDIAADTRRLGIALAIGLAVLYLALFRLVAGASRRLRRQSERNLYLANHDSLTGLKNRDAFIVAVDDRRTTSETEGRGVDLVVLLDLDRFQNINDTLGHEVGDELLRVVGARLLSEARSVDLVARLGGDEFAILLSATNEEQGEKLVGRFIRSLNEPIELGGVRLEIRASVGVSVHNGKLAGNEVLQQADIAMYAAKANHTVIEVFRPDLNQLTFESLELVSEVRSGIEEQQFALHYQPKYSIETGQFNGCEALVRWNHPVRGFVSPARFMPAVEQLPIGRELTDYILASAVAQLRVWQDLGFAFGISVNLSARDVNDPTLPPYIDSLLRRHDLDGRLLTLELTEGTVLTNEDRTISTLQQIRELGCGVSIDDFGTGYASLSYLIRLPATELKIDMSFIRDLDTNEQSRTIVQHCVDIAHSLGLTATAEGIETVEVESLLRTMGCDTGQGYLRSKPLPVDDFVSFITAQPAASTHGQKP